VSKRNLRIVRKTDMLTDAICEYCNAQFRSNLPNQKQAEWEIKTRFHEHKCKREHASHPNNETAH